ncbi:hypothetical protein JXA47_17340 [Candidatus Sumerlaeota bacterium]|nr:hypothetical protein [Candidatus Sumerlaeota bacterium]
MRTRSILLIAPPLALLTALVLWSALSTSRDDLGVVITERAVPAPISIEPDQAVPPGRPSPAGVVHFAVVGDSKGGHQHVYERLAPQHGVHYFISGAGGGASDDLEEEIYPILDSDDRDASGMLWEIEGHLARFQTLSSDGTLIDEGVVEL